MSLKGGVLTIRYCQSLIQSKRKNKHSCFRLTHGRPLAQQKWWVQGDAVGPGGREAVHQGFPRVVCSPLATHRAFVRGLNRIWGLWLSSTEPADCQGYSNRRVSSSSSGTGWMSGHSESVSHWKPGLVCPAGVVRHFGKSHSCVFQTPGYFSKPFPLLYMTARILCKSCPGVQYFQNQDEFLLSRAAEAVHSLTHGVRVEHRWG